MLGTIRIGLALSLGLCVACGGDDPAVDDAGMHDAGPLDAALPDAGPADGGPADGGPTDGGPAARRTYVIDSLSQPQTSGEAAEVGVDLDGDGTVDNQLGQALASLMAATGGDARGDLDEVVARGEVLLLIEARSASFSGDGLAEGRVLLGESPSPMPCATPEDLVCGAHLSGAGTFGVITPAGPLTEGTLASGRLAFGPGDAWIAVSLLGETALVPIAWAQVRARLGAEELDQGILAGAITDDDVDTAVLPALHAGAAAIVARDCDGGPCPSGSEGEAMLGLFDTDDDGDITLEEVRANGLLASLLAPDLDLDGDGTNDALSIGVGFTAVGATFSSP